METIIKNVSAINHTEYKPQMKIVKSMTDSENIDTGLSLQQVFFDNIAVGIMIVDAQTRIIETVNAYAANLFGASPDKIIGQKCHRFICPSMENCCPLCDLNMVIDNSDRVILNSNAEEIPVLKTVKSVVINGEKKLLESFIEITERKKIELQLNESDIKKSALIKMLQDQDEKYRKIISNMQIGIVEVDQNYRVIYVNSQFCSMYGADIDTVKSKLITDLFDSENAETISNIINVTSDENINTAEISIQPAQGDRVWWLINSVAERNENNVFLGCTFVILDISKQRQLQDTLLEAKQYAEKSAKAKELFLTNMSHEIRTPLNVIIGMIREIGKEKLSDSQKTYLKHSESSAYHLLSIINNVLDMSKIEAGEFLLDIRDFSMSAVLSNVHSILTSRASGKKINFEVESSAQIARALRGDSLRLSQVLINLLGNSIKFTDSGFVKLNVTVQNNNSYFQTILFEVSDSGIGMSNDFLQLIFKKFTQESDNANRAYEGTGLGMSISKEIIEMMGGEISINSKKGIGTKIKFIISFPMGNEDKIINIDKVTKNYDIQGKRVLIVEDNEMNRFIARQSLLQAKCVISEAENGLIATEILSREEFDIVLMDIQMPVLDGVEATKIIRNKLLCKTPIIALTANAFKHDIDLYLSVGMNDFLIKPYKEEELFSKIDSNCRNIENTEHKRLPNTNNDAPKTIDLYSIDQLMIIANKDTKIVNAMLEVFVRLCEETIDQLKSGLETLDVPKIKSTAHKIKPSLYNLEIHILYDKIIELESFNMNNHCTDYLQKLVLHVSNVLEDIVGHIKKSVLN